MTFFYKLLRYIFFFIFLICSCKENSEKIDTYEIDSLNIETNNLLSRIYAIDIYKIDSILKLFKDSTKTINLKNAEISDSEVVNKLQKTINWYYASQDELSICQEELKILKEDYNNLQIDDSIYLKRLNREKYFVKDLGSRIDSFLREAQSDIYYLFSHIEN